MKKIITSVLSVAAIVTLTACATSSPDTVRRSDAQTMASIQDGVVLSVRSVTIDGSQSGIGGVVGGAVGAIAGSAGSGVQREQNVLGVLGAVAGAAAGNAIERFSTKEDAVEIIVQLKNGDRRSIVQAVGSEKLAPGDNVILVITGGKVRVSRAPG
jgi:outer membrane lipoprotein SlyB